MAKNMGLRPDDVDDASQEAVIACWRESEIQPLTKKLERTVISRAVKTFIRNDRIETKGQVHLEDLHVPLGSDEPAVLAFNGDFSEVEMGIVLSVLDETEKKIVEALVDDWTYREIGDALGLSHVRIGQIVGKIRKKLTKEQVDRY